MAGMIGGRYQTDKILGKGGMGTVYKAIDTRLGREVALKVINANQQDNGDSAKMLHREAQAIAQLHHPNIVTIYDYSGPDESPIYIAMEMIEGLTLTQILQKSKSLPDSVIMAVLYSVSSALAHAHEHKMIHRDIKPSNIMIESTGRVLLMDFGIAKSLEGQNAGHTQMRGTPNFMAPEQIREQTIGTYTDIFALGSLIYTCASGTPPFATKNTIDTMRRIASLDFRQLKAVKPEVSSVLNKLVNQCMQANPEARPTALDINKACRVFLRQKGVLNPPHHLALYFSKLTGTPVSKVEAPLNANSIAELDEQAEGKTIQGPVPPLTSVPVPQPMNNEASVTNSSVQIPKHLRIVRKNTEQRLAEEAEKKAVAEAAESSSLLSTLWYSIVFIGIIALLGLGGYVIYTGQFLQPKGPEPAALESSDEMEQKVTVRIIPSGMLYVDGMEKGFVKGSKDFMFKSGWYNFEARQRGLEPKKQEVKVVKGQDLTIIFDLTRQ